MLVFYRSSLTFEFRLDCKIWKLLRMYEFTQPLKQDVTQGQFFSQSKANFHSEIFFSCCLTKTKEPNQLYYVPIAREKTN